MPYITPQSIPEETDCRSLLIPASSEWLALFGGALTSFLYSYNWEQTTGISVDDTIAKMGEIIDGFYAGCAMCRTPGGYRVVRINEDGRLEQLGEGGEWEPATDEYYIPPPDARTDGTETDQMCLAAKNAVNVLKQLYEELAEAFADNLSTAEAITAFIAAAIALVGFEFAPITWAIAAFFLVVFEALYQAIAYIAADLWTEDFDAVLYCILLDCASNDAGVVTFDNDCFNAAMEAQLDAGGLSEVQLRLFTQIGYILYFIGGIDGLNLAGRTTEITNDDCDACNCLGTSVQFSVDDQGFSLHSWEGFAGVGTYGGGRWNFDYYPNPITPTSNQLGISGEVALVCGTGIQINFTITPGAPIAPIAQVRVTTGTEVKNATFTPVNGAQSYLWDEGGSLDPDSATVEIGYIGSAGYGVGVGNFQTGDV